MRNLKYRRVKIAGGRHGCGQNNQHKTGGGIQSRSSTRAVRLGNPTAIEYHGSHDEDGYQVTLADTGQDSMTGTRVRLVKKHLDGGTFMLTYGDGVADIDLPALVRFHEAHGRVATVTGVRPSSRFGELLASGDSVTAFSEKPRMHEGLINGSASNTQPASVLR